MFSIIIPLYNKADYIAETLKSVLNQTYCDYEVIVVNDSSTDNSLEVASSFQDERIHIYTKENEGVSAARNYGIMHAKYDYIAFLDADDIWESDYLECQKKLIGTYPDAGIYSTAFYSLEKGKRKLRNVLINEHIHFLVHDYFKESVMNGLSICWTSSLCLKKEVIKEIPMFRVGIKRGEDLDLWLRIALNYDVAYLNLPKVFYRTGLSDSLTSDYSKNGEFPYYEWFNFTSESSYYRKYVILVVYIHAKNAFIHHDYDTCLAELWSVKTIAWRFKWAERLLLLVISWIKSKVSSQKLAHN